MSRSGYSDDCDGWALIRWRGAVASAIRGKRGQAMLQELVQALDALPDKRLVADSLVSADGEFCTLGALGRARGIDMAALDPDDRSSVAHAFGLPEALAAEVMFLNDEGTADDWKFIDVEICGPMRQHWPDWGRHERTVRVPNEHAGRQRWGQMRAWAVANLRPPNVRAKPDTTAEIHDEQ